MQLLTWIEVALREQVGGQRIFGVHVEDENAVRLHVMRDAPKCRLQLVRIENVVERVVEASCRIETIFQVEVAEVPLHKSGRSRLACGRPGAQLFLRYFDHASTQINAHDLKAAPRQLKRQVARATGAIEHTTWRVRSVGEQRQHIFGPVVVRHDLHQFVVVRRQVSKLHDLFVSV